MDLKDGGVQVKIISTGAFFDYKTTYQRILIIWGCAGTSPYLQI